MKKAFSLIELLIVVVILGVVYSMAIGTIQKSSKVNVEEVTLKNLKRFLQSFEYKKSVKLLCLDSCLSCNVYIDGNKDEESKDSFENFLTDDVEIYRYDYNSGMEEKKQEVFFNSEDVEEDVCFSYTVDKKGIGDQVFVKFNDKVYDFTSDSPLSKVYKSLREIQDAKEELRGLLR